MSIPLSLSLPLEQLSAQAGRPSYLVKCSEKQNKSNEEDMEDINNKVMDMG